jgi:phosphatidylglycerol:prolipoprotein diacylglycerol transferase
VRAYPEIDPVAIALGPLQIHWYGLSYLAGLGLAWWLMAARARGGGRWSSQDVSDLIFHGALGIVLGGRLGYMLFYGFDRLREQPLALLRIWEGGMSFHGGMLGVLVALALYARGRGRGFFEVADFVAPAVPLGLGMGRLGNFINAELPGRVTDVPWALIYPGDSVARHPSSLYQFALEGPLLFLVLFAFSARPRPRMAVSGAFLAGYGTLRIITECFREPDPQLRFLAFDWLTMGQLLSLPMLLIGLGMLSLARAAKPGAAPATRRVRRR